jgi:MFS family permease
VTTPFATRSRGIGHLDITAKTATTVVVANALEFFDYFSYATYIAFINRAFFPESGHALGLIYSLGIFAAGFLARPLGAVLIGIHADTKGRKPALLMTSVMVTIGTLGVAAIPGYSTIGPFSPALLLLCRLVQGIAIGGEIGVSASLLIERCRVDRKAWYAGWLLAGQGFALIASGLCGSAVFALMTPSEVQNWGWRIPFALASAIVPLQLYLRRHVLDDSQSSAGTLSGCETGLREPKKWLAAIMLILGGTVPTYMASYTAAFGVSGTAPTPETTANATIAVGAVSLILSILGGRFADRIGYVRTIALSRIATMIAVLPLFQFAAHDGSPAVLTLTVAMFAGISAFGGGPTIVTILEMFPERGRALSLSLVYSVGVALFGGTAPLIVAAINLLTGSHIFAAWYIVVSAATALLALSLGGRRAATESKIALR